MPRPRVAESDTRSRNRNLTSQGVLGRVVADTLGYPCRSGRFDVTARRLGVLLDGRDVLDLEESRRADVPRDRNHDRVGGDGDASLIDERTGSVRGSSRSSPGPVVGSSGRPVPQRTRRPKRKAAQRRTRWPNGSVGIYPSECVDAGRSSAEESTMEGALSTVRLRIRDGHVAGAIRLHTKILSANGQRSSPPSPPKSSRWVRGPWRCGVSTVCHQSYLVIRVHGIRFGEDYIANI